MPATWTAPKTWVLDEVVDETDMNTHVRDNLLWLKSDPLISETSITAPQTASNTTITVLTLAGVVIPAEVGKVYVEAWAPLLAQQTGASAAAYIEEATAGIVAFANASGSMYIRSSDLSWSNSTRTITLKLAATNGEGYFITQNLAVWPTQFPIVLRVVRSY